MERLEDKDGSSRGMFSFFLCRAIVPRRYLERNSAMSSITSTSLCLIEEKEMEFLALE